MYNYTLTIKDSPFERNFTDLKECLYYILLREDAGKVADIISSIYDPEDESWIDTYMQGYQLASDVEVAALVERDDTMFYYVLQVAHGRRIVGQFNGKSERTIV